MKLEEVDLLEKVQVLVMSSEYTFKEKCDILDAIKFTYETFNHYQVECRCNPDFKASVQEVINTMR